MIWVSVRKRWRSDRTNHHCHLTLSRLQLLDTTSMGSDDSFSHDEIAIMVTQLNVIFSFWIEKCWYFSGEGGTNWFQIAISIWNHWNQWNHSKSLEIICTYCYWMYIALEGMATDRKVKDRKATFRIKISEINNLEMQDNDVVCATCTLVFIIHESKQGKRINFCTYK